MKIVHTSDWQIGRTFSFVDDDALGALQAERLNVIERIGMLARAQGAAHVLVAGDVYEHETPSGHTLRQPMERMRQFADISWHLIPGNHDAHTPQGVWSRLQRDNAVPANVKLHLASAPVELDGTHNAWLLPAVLQRRHTLSDLTAYMDDAPTPEGALRIGVAHGSVVGFGNEGEAQNNPIAIDRAARAGLAYLALGDWHGFNRINDRTVYAGTPEVDRFGTGGNGGGECVVVAFDGPTAPPRLSTHRTGRFAWCKFENVVLTSSADIHALESRVRAIAPEQPHTILAWLEVGGMLGVEDLALYESLIDHRLRSALACLRLSGAPSLAAGADDLDMLGTSGPVRAAAAALLEQVNAGGAEASVAQEALQRLFLLWGEVRRATP
ncbi:MAG: DNA repair exonuclease [Acetobacter fabarum]|jgi:DNA repair exonuclease SbcCD nuclease subunit|uniref:metallophosphoesterase family protein n=1 Tax=Acetobacter fabarum TaxID=483199 RepID=UPI002431AC02|nr:DNA repair exonuclease [Acetobacter fabarum]MCH4026180.1 DNA repair exonuclease [Acetobacter fabarum]MCH4054929.1 DNA repair exonuclease [Acetobacter fabarum]MCH4085958.1 DNA repair exonuclease [Acetobacter fabarum]MCH4127450.1 DNA repair exonuclease [Acetobacter fabarum]MCH4136799.1 DNA repair exonuclease [Acetobacter fabarum]